MLDTQCQCRMCLRKRDNPKLPRIIALEFQQMILCPICRNKKCPHATDHELECTGSNEPGQKGSYYE